MMNRLGKLLVLLNVALSMAFLAVALAIYFQAIDWGWSEARKDLANRVASEIDKRAAAVLASQRVVDLVVGTGKPDSPGLTNAQRNLAEIEPYLSANHLWYREQLKQLQSATKDIVVKEIKLDDKDGTMVVDSPKGKARFGKPVLGEVAGDITKSFDSYVADLKALQEQIDASDKKIRELVEEEGKLTLRLLGTKEKDKPGKLGLYALLEKEADAQANIRAEREYIERQWANVQQEHDLYIGRQQQLESTLARLKKLRGVK